MERKIGEIFEFEGKIYETIGFPSNSCFSCAFIKLCRSGMGEVIGNCCGDLREDKTDVFFKEIKKDMKIKDNKLTINIPDGMEIDVENSDLKTGVIKFKKKEIRYEDIEASLKLNKNMTGIDVADENVNRLCAINRLMCIAKFYNGNWKPNWNSVESKYCILYSNRAQCYITDYRTCFAADTVYFKREKDAQAVIDNPNFREILDVIYNN